MGELLCLLQSCQPTLSQLCSCLSLQIPRYYSIASSFLSSPGQLSFAFSVVHYVCGVNASSTAGLRLRIGTGCLCTYVGFVIVYVCYLQAVMI